MGELPEKIITKMGLSQELTCQPAVAKKSLPPKPKKDQANMMLDLRNFPKKPESTMDTSSSHDTLLDTPTMDQADFNWSSLQDESHLNSVPDFQEELEWNNNEEIHSQMFGGSLELEPHPYQEPEQMDVTVQPKQELHDMTCVAPALVEGTALSTATICAWRFSIPKRQMPYKARFSSLVFTTSTGMKNSTGRAFVRTLMFQARLSPLQRPLCTEQILPTFSWGRMTLMTLHGSRSKRLPQPPVRQVPDQQRPESFVQFRRPP